MPSTFRVKTRNDGWPGGYFRNLERNKNNAELFRFFCSFRFLSRGGVFQQQFSNRKSVQEHLFGRVRGRVRFLPARSCKFSFSGCFGEKSSHESSRVESCAERTAHTKVHTSPPAERCTPEKGARAVPVSAAGGVHRERARRVHVSTRHQSVLKPVSYTHLTLPTICSV